MWTRKQLKEKAKFALNHNYWKVILVSLIIVMVGGASTYNVTYDASEEVSTLLEEDNTLEEDEFYYEYEYEYDSDDVFEEESPSVAYIIGFIIGFLIVFTIVYVVIMAIYLLYATFILNPVDLGCRRFFFKTLNQKAEVKEVAFAFDNNYKNVAKIMFFRDLYIMLWSFLFIIPGIVKSYEYMMIPYLLAENPNLTKEQAFAISKQMMTGQKWRTFVLHLSFFWWDVLSLITAGIVSVFYVQPYRNLTFAALYEELSLMNGRPAFAVQQPNMNNPYQQGNPYSQMNPYGQPMQQAHPVPPVQPMHQAHPVPPVVPQMGNQPNNNTEE